MHQKEFLEEVSLDLVFHFPLINGLSVVVDTPLNLRVIYSSSESIKGGYKIEYQSKFPSGFA